MAVKPESQYILLETYYDTFCITAQQKIQRDDHRAGFQFYAQTTKRLSLRRRA